MKFPKIANLYWDLSPMSYLQLLTVKSFYYYNPGFDINVYVPNKRSDNVKTWDTHEQNNEYTGKDYWPEVLKLNYVNIIEFDFKDLDFSNDIAEVHKSDILRLHLLATEGGYWLDFDIFFTKPITSIIINEGLYNCDVLLSYYDKIYPIGLLASTPNNKLFNFLFNYAKVLYNPKQYECVGCLLYLKALQNIENTRMLFSDMVIGNIARHTVYMIHPTKLELLFDPEHKQAGNNKLSKSIGVHWYNGHPDAKEFCNNYDKDIDCLMNKLIKGCPFN